MNERGRVYRRACGKRVLATSTCFYLLRESNTWTFPPKQIQRGCSLSPSWSMTMPPSADGRNMQRQGVPRYSPNRCCGHGKKPKPPVTAGKSFSARRTHHCAVTAPISLLLRMTDATSLSAQEIRADQPGTCINQRPIVSKGACQAGQVLADSSAPSAETGPGQNVWRLYELGGYNYEDAIIRQRPASRTR